MISVSSPRIESGENEMLCTYERTIYENGDNGFCIALFTTQDSTVPAAARSRSVSTLISFTATGYRLPTTKAIDVELDGRWENSKYGLQYVVDSFTEVIPKTKDGIIGYLSSGLIKGIGEKTARAIVAKFGLNALEIIAKTPERLTEVKGITGKKLEKITQSYQQSVAVRDVVTFLSPFGITVKKALKIHKEYGVQTMDILKKRPFELCKISGFGFKTVDAIARKAACRLNDPMRIQGAALFRMDESQARGHLYLCAAELRELSYELLNDGFDREVVSKTEINTELYQMVMGGILINENGNLYKPCNLSAEQKTAEKLCGLLKAHSKTVSIEQELIDAQKELNIILAPKQCEAVRSCFASNLSIITGGPGTGKTTVLKVILRIYNRLIGGNILLTAPTGRAARRMSESTGHPDARTLHSALGLMGDDEDGYQTSGDALEADFIVIDEFSMVDMRLAKELFSRIRQGTKVLIVGDADQLPSVGAGNVFRELIGCGLIPVTVLDVIYRQSNTSRIALNAGAIHDGNSKLLYGENFVF